MGTARVQGARDVSMNELSFRGISVNDATNNTASVTVYASDSGILFINEYAGTTTYTLPAVADCKGKIFHFLANVANNIAITGGTAAKFCGATQTDYDTMTLTGAIGGSASVIGDGERYYLIAGTGTWTAST
jgi:hypothetical protein